MMSFTLHEQKRLGEQLDKCKNLFRLVTDSFTDGRLVVAVENMFDCSGNYNITVQVVFDIIYEQATRDINRTIILGL